MRNPIQEMRQRMVEEFGGGVKPLQGLEVTSVFRPTANNSPRLPQSTIARPKPTYDKPGRPTKENQAFPATRIRTEFKDSFKEWL